MFPLFKNRRTGNFKYLIFESGGFPSSHTALVIGLTLALGYQSVLFFAIFLYFTCLFINSDL
ncbi:divergent PAP2 family protein [Erysipelothrix piscisicarius]|uniref:divergent PAP2 family protein n=1 Tax=Erysipelothrix piscisicarius TaxID=2485784 RepID=UPI002F92330B